MNYVCWSGLVKDDDDDDDGGDYNYYNTHNYKLLLWPLPNYEFFFVIFIVANKTD